MQQLNKMADTVIQLNQLKTLLVDVRHELTIAPETLSQQMKEVIAPRAEKLTQMDSLLGLIDANLSGTSADGDTEKSEKGEIFSSGVDFF
jgi:hypothetical protein